ncbi:unnamed protein product [Lupinus luteus]|uniref:Fiber protein Fb15 n=1 Tax=Lupinus luteus TaxID=3873 RepID=A0AAV1W6F2_LUPLU
MASQKFFNELRTLKVKEVPQHVKPYLSFGFVKKSVEKGLENYRVKYIETNSADPVYHICFGGLIFSYLVALPEERRHLAHQQQHGGGH